MLARAYLLEYAMSLLSFSFCGAPLLRSLNAPSAVLAPSEATRWLGGRLFQAGRHAMAAARCR